MTHSLTLIGMGEDGIEGLSAAARTMIETADVIVGSGRLLAMLPPLKAALHNWPSPFDPMIERIESWTKKRVVILATGDPMNYGVGAILAPRLKETLKVIPSPSAFSLAAARMGWALQDVEMLSLHGRDASLIEPFLAPAVRLIALTEGDETVRAAAERLVRRGFGESRITVLEHMGGPLERRVSFVASDPPKDALAQLSTMTIDCVGRKDAILLPRIAGLPDDAFRHDGQITKREVRAATLSALLPLAGTLLWDVGAGCGSIAVEWMRSARGARAIAIEQDANRSKLIAENARNLGTPGVEIIVGQAPAVLGGLPQPDAVFVGGSVSNGEIFDIAWNALPTRGRLVCNAVTLESESMLIALHGKWGGELVRLEVSSAGSVGNKRAMRRHLPVTQWRVTKP